ncbi:MAG: hypothetical protein V1776_02420 [Candidatus Diapherotrites archaeon]
MSRLAYGTGLQHSREVEKVSKEIGVVSLIAALVITIIVVVV